MNVTIDFIRSIVLICLVCSVVTGFLNLAGAKPTIPFNLPPSLQGFPTLTSLTQQIIENRNARQMKTYSGRRLSNDSLIMIYYHDATIAVTELGPQKLLLNCELIEIYNDKEGDELLKSLSKYNKPLEITFNDMIKLMNQCERVDRLLYASRENGKSMETHSNNKINLEAFNLDAIFPKSPFTLLNGIIPGTKWCGTGDIAETYHDLGAEINMDRCCRQHDLCPIKLKAYQSKYDLTNDSIYTKSHCVCDDMLYSCLKETNTPASQFMGTIYFNLVQVPCLVDDNNRYHYRPAKEGF